MKKLVKAILPNKVLEYLRSSKQQFRHMRNGFPYREYTKQYKCIFIHIPKTAGTSILTCLMGDKIYREHASYFDFQRIDTHRFDEYFKFCFVRNPYDRAVSSYEYLKKGGDKQGDLYFQQLFESKYPTFEKFILEYLDKDKIYEHTLFRPQYLFIYNYKNECQVDYVGKYENIKSDFKIICKKLGVSFDLPSKNRVKRNPYENYYSNQLVKQKIENLYSKDFFLFKYSKI
ncbi:hypothetical protein CXF72_06340 [Psychromonas sp. MB-3u-54]|uniref:sulfotransferase family 2 domain-containing protein n=1 Tax=Psychromonas sp. MB-3u-54 TaxID=2058319 RepID=UPI000C34BF8D|nr:sulfotransferase family 2 domain-containing protein [Psychromonas sp. MB-3u-54]PKH03425.1 hypothetical protein CXF72_06340 [Psychromonas sp. MB-3u-54]